MRLYRTGTKVITADMASRRHNRTPDRREDIGVIIDHYHPFGRGSKDKSAPYLVRFSDGESQWFDADEVDLAARRPGR